MTQPISYLRDDFITTSLTTVWGNSFSIGSAALAQTGGQMVVTLPSSTAGTHTAACRTSGAYDLTGDSAYLNIATMVNTGVAASAFYDLLISDSNMVRWIQTSGTIKAQKIVAGVTTDLFSATWSGTTYKYLRIRESGGTVYWDSSSNGTSWTNRASATVASLFAVTALLVQFGATCGNVASPGQFKVDDFNLILPALTTNWRWVEGAWPLTHRFRNVTLAIDTAATVQGYLSIYSSIDSSGNPVSPIYYSGPIDSSGNLTAQSTQAAAQAMAVNLPLDGRWSLPTMVECRFIRLYCRSIDGSSFVLKEQYGRRLIQTDDIEAEAIRAHHIAAAQITADHINVTELSAITANIGFLTITDTNGDPGWLYQGSGTGDVPTTGLKIFNVGGIGKLSTYNTAAEQITLDTDGKLKWAGGLGWLNAEGMTLVQTTDIEDPRSVLLTKADGITAIGRIGGAYATSGGVMIESVPQTGMGGFVTVNGYAPSGQTARVFVRAQAGIPNAYIELMVTGGIRTCEIAAADGVNLLHGLNVGSATGAGTGEIKSSGAVFSATTITAGSTTTNDGALNSRTSADTKLVLTDTRSYSNGITRIVDLHFKAANPSSDFTTNSATIRADITPATGITIPASELSFWTANNSTGAGKRVSITGTGDVLPGAAGAQNLGNASLYWNDVSYKTLTDRGCLALIDEWELADGRRVSATQVFQEMRADPSKRTIYDEPMLDYTTVPKHSRKPAPIADQDVYEDDPIEREPDGKPKRKIKHRQGEKMGDDGVEMTSLFSQMIGAIRELTSRVATLERGVNGRPNRA